MTARTDHGTPAPKARVVHVKVEQYDVYIGRFHRGYGGGKWGNPFVIGRDGDRDEVIRKHTHWFFTSPDPRAAWQRDNVHRLAGKVLGCWCKTPDRDVPCHGDLLAVVADTMAEPDEEAARVVGGPAGAGQQGGPR